MIAYYKKPHYKKNKHLHLVFTPQAALDRAYSICVYIFDLCLYI